MTGKARQERHRLPRLVPIALILALILLLVFVFLDQVSQLGASIEGCQTGCAAQVTEGDDTIRVLSLNMLHGYPDFEDLDERLDIIVAGIQDADADIVMLQEVPWTRELGDVAATLADRLGMNFLYYRANGNRHLIFFEEGELILSRYPLLNSEAVELKPRAGFFENQVVLHADVATPLGDLGLFVTHLTHSNPQANPLQAEALLEYVNSKGEELKVVAGDFNATPDSPQIQTLSQQWIDTYTTLHPEKPGFTSSIDDLHNDRSEPLERRIDYIFLANEGADAIDLLDARRVFDQPVRTTRGWQWASDHIGLLITLGFVDQ